MKNRILTFGVALLALVAGTSCSKDDTTTDSGAWKIEFAEKSYELETGETKQLNFTVSGAVEDFAIEIKVPEEGWKVNGLGKTQKSEGVFDCTFSLTAPEVKSSGKLYAEVTTASGKLLSGSCTVASSDDLSDDVKLTLDKTSCTVTPSATAELGFTVTGKGALNLTAAVVAESKDWKCSVKTFAVASKGGYEGTLSITAPATVGTSKATLTLTNKKGKEVASGVITLSATEISVTFDSAVYEFDALESKNIKIDVTCGGTVTLKSIVTDLWRVESNTSTRKEDGSGYTGTVKLMAPSIPDEASFIIRVIDSANNENDFAVKVICEGGLPTPAPKSGANCIVVSDAGAVSFDAVKGNGMAVSGAKVVRVWSDAEGLLDENSLKYNGGKISFSTATEFKAGNAVVALLDSAGKIVWTWHLWFVQGLNLDAASGTFLNMNLGATSSEKVAESLGLLYQWGRKEAFPGPKDFQSDAESAAEAFISDYTKPTLLADGYAWGVLKDTTLDSADVAAQHPTELGYLASQIYTSQTTAAWSAESDPCPKGWRVPNHHELAEHWGVIEDNVFQDDLYSAYGHGAAPAKFPNEWWPAAGNRMTHNGMSGWDGALRLTNYAGYYWTSTSSYSKSEYDSEADIQDIGYNSAPVLSWSCWNKLNISLSASNAKSTAASVRCIKE